MFKQKGMPGYGKSMLCGNQCGRKYATNLVKFS
jgi:hypothetical protein